MNELSGNIFPFSCKMSNRESLLCQYLQFRFTRLRVTSVAGKKKLKFLGTKFKELSLYKHLADCKKKHKLNQ